MFCRFCGKELQEDASFCGNCGAAVEKEAVAETFFAEEKPLPIGNPRMLGFGRALTGTILSFVGMIFFCIACALITGAESYDYFYGRNYIYEEDLFASLAFVMGAIALGVISVVFGVKSIKTFKKAQGPKPIPTLVLGIASLAEGASCLLCNAILFFPLVILLAEI